MAWISRLIALLTTAAIGVALHSAYTKQHLIIPHASLIHLLTTSLSTGLQLWTTFGFGILAFKALPRHMFGHLQSRLFPTYFAVVTVCTALQLLVLFTSTKLSTSSAQFQFKVCSFVSASCMHVFAPTLCAGAAGGAWRRSAQHCSVWYVSVPL